MLPQQQQRQLRRRRRRPCWSWWNNDCCCCCCPSTKPRRRQKKKIYYLILIGCVVICLMFTTYNNFLFIFITTTTTADNDEEDSNNQSPLLLNHLKNNNTSIAPRSSSSRFNSETITITTQKFHTIHLPSSSSSSTSKSPNNNNNFVNVTITSRFNSHNSNRNNINRRPIISSSSSSFKQQRRRNAIVYLVQKTHSTYDNRDSYGMLLQSLDLLYENYLSKNQDNSNNTDIYLFHTGDFQPSDLDIIEPHVLPFPPPKTTIETDDSEQHADDDHHQQSQSSSYNRGIIKLVNINQTKYWNLPINLRNDNPTKDWIDYNLFPLGYRHMCRFFAIKIWDFFDTMNKHLLEDDDDAKYQYIWRLDEDSLILSPIRYNIFDYMQKNQYKYGYRMCSYELSQHKFGTHNWFTKKQSTIKSKQRSIDYELCGFYNNFFIANLDFMLSKKPQSLLNEIDKRGFIYRRRMGDLIIHSLVVYSFAPPEQIHRFLDFTYQHVTIDKRVSNCLLWGGIQTGYLDSHPTNSITNFQKQHNLLVINNDYGTNDNNNHRNNKDNNTNNIHYCVANITKLTYEDLSPTYSHLSNELQKSISLQTITAGKVELVGKGILSG